MPPSARRDGELFRLRSRVDDRQRVRLRQSCDDKPEEAAHRAQAQALANRRNAERLASAPISPLRRVLARGEVTQGVLVTTFLGAPVRLAPR